MPVVADSSVLIWLARAGKLNLLRDQYETVIVPREVYYEVVEEGIREGHADAHVIKDAVEQGWIRIESVVSDGERRIAADINEIHEGEAAALGLAMARSLPILLDESSGRAVAEALGLKARGTLSVVLRALREGGLTRPQARDVIASMVASGFRIEPSLLERVLREVTQFRPG